MVEAVRKFFEIQAFGVCTRLADRLHMRVSFVRLFFIYLSFIAMGSPLLIYLLLAFVLRIKDKVNSRKTSVFDL